MDMKTMLRTIVVNCLNYNVMNGKLIVLTLLTSPYRHVRNKIQKLWITRKIKPRLTAPTGES